VNDLPAYFEVSKPIIDIWSENINEINHFADLDIDGTRILKWIVKK